MKRSGLILAAALAALALSSCGLRGDLNRPAPLFGEEKARYEAEQKAKAEAEKAKPANGERQRMEVPVTPAPAPSPAPSR
jgi:predicted small lipoprotein YifL